MDKRSFLFIILISICFFLIQYWFPITPSKPTTQPQKQVSETKHFSSEPKEPLSPKHVEEIENTKEEFYVIENDYMQVVFSNIGGAISEINFPFQSKGNKNSLVHPIKADKTISETSPINDYFPSTPYYSYENGSSLFHNKGKLGGYHPLLRRSIYNSDGSIRNKILPRYYLGNLVDSSNVTEKLPFKVTQFDDNSITFSGRYNNRMITKRFSFTKSKYETTPYCINLSIDLNGQSDDLWITSGVPEVDSTPGQTTTLKYRHKNGNKYTIDKISLPKTAMINNAIYPDWISDSNGFFGVILNPKEDTVPGFRAINIPGTTLPTRLTLIDPKYDLYPANKYPGYETFLPIGSSKEKVELNIFAGPYQAKLLNVVDQVLSDPISGYTPDYFGAKASQGFFSYIITPFSKLLFMLMSFFHMLTHSWGFSIILLTIAFRIMLYPLNSWSIKSNLKMQEMAPHTKAIQKRYKSDPKKAQAELIKYYKEMGTNPLTGCFPILIQMPFLFGMFDILRTTFDLRGVGFIPGWINNLTAPDVLFSWSYPIFFFGTEFHLLPIVLGVITYLQQQMTTKLPKDKSELSDQQKQQKMMMYMMPIIFTFITYNLASGLNIYWLCSTLLGIGQQSLMSYKKKKLKVKVKT